MKTLYDWLLEQPQDVFPGSGARDHPGRLRNVAEYLERNVHPIVEKGALLHSGDYLNGHGVDHVRAVIERASQLLAPPDSKLNPYEAYLLLMATHFHDVANVLGRSGHEARIPQIISLLAPFFENDPVEIRTVVLIASAHGGNIAGDRDTISALPSRQPVNGVEIRIQLLAALLRFADELADDSTRASRFEESLNLVPTPSEVFHQYSLALHSVIVDADRHAVNLHFDIHKEAAMKKLGKKSESVYLLDEIYTRTVKMHVERLYCMRYMAAVTRIDAINATVKVFLPNMIFPVKVIQYTLEERGYPDLKAKDIRKLCPGYPDVKCTGEKLEKELLRLRTP